MQSLYKIIKESPHDILPFEMVEHKDYEYTLNQYFFPEASMHLRVFGKDNSGSFVCFWNKTEFPAGSNDEPIIWLDSEATPMAVIAQNLKELISVVPYGLLFLREIMLAWVRNYQNPRVFDKPSRIKKFLDKEQLLIKELSDRNNQIFLFENNLILHRSNSPVIEVELANDLNPEFHSWVKLQLSKL